VNVAGVFHLEDPVENSSTEGAAIGAIIGVYRLDKNKTDVKLYDPTGNVLRLDMNIAANVQLALRRDFPAIGIYGCWGRRKVSQMVSI
jgi:hypothetical protein